MRIDVHQHLWSDPLVEALAARSELPFVRFEQGLTVLYLAGERPYVIDLEGERPERRAQTVVEDGLDSAVLCLSSPIGIEALPREQAAPLLDAFHEGALQAGRPFSVWGAVALDRLDAGDVDRALSRGCVGISLPADAIAGAEPLQHVAPLLARLEALDAPLFVHPGPAPWTAPAARAGGCSLNEPLWWPALTRYLSGMQAAWFAFNTLGRAEHPRLRIVFSMLAGLAPLHGERLAARGAIQEQGEDALTFYETSSYGTRAISAMAATVGREQIVYGSDRPVVQPQDTFALDWELLCESAGRAFASRPRELVR